MSGEGNLGPGPWRFGPGDQWTALKDAPPLVCFREEHGAVLLEIEKAAKAVARARQISRQAALNALPDLIAAVNKAGGPWS